MEEKKLNKEDNVVHTSEIAEEDKSEKSPATCKTEKEREFYDFYERQEITFSFYDEASGVTLL